MQYTLDELATKLNGELIGDGQILITGVAGVESAEHGDLLFAESPRFFQAALSGRASAILVDSELASKSVGATKALVVVPLPRTAFAMAMQLFDPSVKLAGGIHATASIGEGSIIAPSAFIGQNVVIGKDVAIDEGAAIHPGVVVGDRCRIGANTVLHSNVVLYHDVTVGSSCILHAGCILGADGFGFVAVGQGLMKVPHLGRVELGDNVEVGANACIDRAKTGVTRIGAGTKIDNLVHIAHNVSVGQSCLIMAQAGLAGTVTLGNGVVIAGQVAVKDHVTLGDGAMVVAQAGVGGNVAAGTVVSGYFAKPHKQALREVGALAHLPEGLKRIRALERRLAACETALGTGTSSPNDFPSTDEIPPESGLVE